MPLGDDKTPKAGDPGAKKDFRDSWVVYIYLGTTKNVPYWDTADNPFGKLNFLHQTSTRPQT